MRRVMASPLAKRLASERSIDLRTIRGTGPGGRIVPRTSTASGAPTAPAPTAVAAAPSPATTQGLCPRPQRPASSPTCWASTWRECHSTRSRRRHQGRGRPPRPQSARRPLRRQPRPRRSCYVRSRAAAGRPGADVDDPADRHARHDRQTHARVAGADGTADAVHGRRRSTPSSPTALDASRLGPRAELHRLRDRRGRSGAGAASARQLPDHRRRRCAAPGPCMSVMAVALDGGLIVPVIRDTATRDLDIAACRVEPPRHRRTHRFAAACPTSRAARSRSARSACSASTGSRR